MVLGQLFLNGADGWISFPGHRVLLAGHKTRDAYGTLMSEEVYLGCQSRLSRDFAMETSEGLITLDIQERLYQFLERFVQTLLSDTVLSRESVDNLNTSVAPNAIQPQSNHAVDW